MNGPAPIAASNQCGAALITALLVVALATATAVAMTADRHRDLRRTANLLHGDQAYVHALGVEDWARSVLARDGRADAERGQRLDSLREAWAQPLPATEIPGGSVRGRIEDLQGRFNVNNLAAADASAAPLRYFRRLLAGLDLEPGLADRIADWVDADMDARVPHGAEDLQYLRGARSRRAGNGPLGHVSELRAVAGVTPQVYARLAPHVTALPELTAINVNTAPPAVLAALGESVAERLDAVLARRESAPFATVAEFLEAAGLEETDSASGTATSEIATLVGVSSGYFAVHGDARIDRLQVQLDSTVARAAHGAPRVITRRRIH